MFRSNLNIRSCIQRLVFTEDILEVYYWIIRDNLNDRQIAARLRKLDRHITSTQALKKAQNYVKMIRKKLCIKRRKGIIEYA